MELTDVLLQAGNATRIAKDMVLAELLQPVFAGSRPLAAFRIGSMSVCYTALVRILGIGKHRAARLRKGCHDGRFGPRAAGDLRNRHNEAFSLIYSHLWHGALPTLPS